jgi:ABC-type branched-subunit amino acid transport system permease subunit
MALLSTSVGFELVQKTGNFWIALPLAMILGALFSALVEILLIRTLIKHSTTGPVAGIVPIIATLGLLGVIRASIGFIWGNQDIQIQPPLSKVGFKVGEETIALSPMNLLVLLTVVGMVILLGFIFQILPALRRQERRPQQTSSLRQSGSHRTGPLHGQGPSISCWWIPKPKPPNAIAFQLDIP